MTLAYVQSGDGSTPTLMLSENLRAVHWGYSLSASLDRKWNFGFCWAQPNEVYDGLSNDDERQYYRINGNDETDDYSRIDDMKPADGFPSSNHPGGVNVAFVAGNVKMLSENIQPLVYALLMTPNRKGSQLFLKSGLNDETMDEDLRQPSDDQY